MLSQMNLFGKNPSTRMSKWYESSSNRGSLIRVNPEFVDWTSARDKEVFKAIEVEAVRMYLYLDSRDAEVRFVSAKAILPIHGDDLEDLGTDVYSFIERVEYTSYNSFHPSSSSEHVDWNSFRMILTGCLQNSSYYQTNFKAMSLWPATGINYHTHWDDKREAYYAYLNEWRDKESTYLRDSPDHIKHLVDKLLFTQKSEFISKHLEFDSSSEPFSYLMLNAIVVCR